MLAQRGSQDEKSLGWSTASRPLDLIEELVKLY